MGFFFNLNTFVLIPFFNHDTVLDVSKVYKEQETSSALSKFANEWKAGIRNDSIDRRRGKSSSRCNEDLKKYSTKIDTANFTPTLKQRQEAICFVFLSTGSQFRVGGRKVTCSPRDTKHRP